MSNEVFYAIGATTVYIRWNLQTICVTLRTFTTAMVTKSLFGLYREICRFSTPYFCAKSLCRLGNLDRKQTLYLNVLCHFFACGFCLSSSLQNIVHYLRSGYMYLFIVYSEFYIFCKTEERVNSITNHYILQSPRFVQLSANWYYIYYILNIVWIARFH